MKATDFPHLLQLEVIFRDIDGMGHVNNAVFITHMETARTKFMSGILNLNHPSELPLILAETTCSYKSPAFFGETLLVGSGVSRWGNKSFDMVHLFTAEHDERLVALGKATVVYFDYAENRPKPIPEAFKTAVNALQGDWQFTPPAR